MMFNFMKSVSKGVILMIAAALFSSFKNKEVTWIAIGDSITYLNDHTEQTGNRITKGYLTDVVEQIPGLKYINKGYNGWTSGNIARQIDSIGLIKADIYSVFLGTNDWWQGRPIGNLDDYKNNAGNTSLFGSYRIIINKIRNLNPYAKIVLITPMQRADFVYINDPKNNAYGSYKLKNGQSLEAFAKAIDSIGQYEHIPVVDLYHDNDLKLENMVHFKRMKDPVSGLYKNYKYPAWTNLSFNPATDEYPYPKEAINLTYDGLHPSQKGNAIIAKAISREFKKLDLMNNNKPVIQLVDTTAPRWSRYIDLNLYNRPFWKVDTIIDETVQVIRDKDQATATLLYKAKNILFVRSANRSREFEKGKDWDYKGGKLVFSPTSSVPYFHTEDLLFNHDEPGKSMKGITPDTYVLFNEGAYFSSMQLSVTYVKEKSSKWNGPVPVFAESGLVNTIVKLKNKEAVNIVFYGNSIEVGYNASGLENKPPYMPIWPELLVNNLKHTYGAVITTTNTSVAGKMASWGRDSVVSKVIPAKPDLVIIGFGMNDGTFKVPPDIYRGQIKDMIDSVRLVLPTSEFILIAPMLANPKSSFSGSQELYKAELDKLAGKGVVIANMTGVHSTLLEHKNYQDMTGNNINHPNDYLARWYAQVIGGLLIP